MKKILDKDISFLELGNDILLKLNSNNIIRINDLWKINRMYLKEMGFNNDEIKKIVIQMQLHGIDLNKRVY